MTADTSPVLVEKVAAYLALRRALGYRLLAHEKALTDYVTFAAARDVHTVTVSMTAAWAEHRPGLSPSAVARRASTVRLFADYLRAFDPDCEQIPAKLVGGPLPRRAPFIFTAEQITALLDATATISPLLWAAGARTLIGLLAATGLRPGEAWRLDDTDLHTDDAGQGLLLIRCSKWGRTRQIPLHPSTVTALTDYQRQREELRRSSTRQDPNCPALIVDGAGQRLHTVGPSTMFRRLLAETQIGVPPGQRAPRAHDLRHTFAVNTLRDWHAAGLAVQPRLGALSAYLGHVNPAHTYWYFQAVPELMTVLGQRRDSHGAAHPQVTG
jgi:integrase/recombinase XerD